jgi:histidinol-phosphate aminotransferase
MQADIPTPKPWIAGIAPYVPGRATTDSGRVAVKLSSNENPFGQSPAALEAMRSAVEKSHRYPDGGAAVLRAEIARTFDLDPERIVCGSGSDDILHLLANAYAGPGDEILYVRHGFAVYRLAAERVGATPVEAPDRDYTTDVDALLARVTEATRLVYIANPNNPTGTVIGRSEVERLHAGLPAHVVLVLDAAYAEFIDDPDYEDGLALARVHPNVVTTRTFSKIYGLAAERVGWGYGPAPIMATLNKIRQPFNVTTPGIYGAAAALRDTAFVERARAHNASWRAWLADQLGALGNAGVRVVPSAANFILVTFPPEGPYTAEAAYKALMEDGYITRWLPSQGLPHALRISIGTEAEVRGVADSLRRFVAGGR